MTEEQNELLREDAPPVQASRMRRFLMFPLVRAIIAIGVMFIVVLPFRFLLPEGSALVISETILATAALTALLFVGRVIERREPKDFGLATVGGARDLAIGFLIGAGILSLVIGILALGGWYKITSIGVQGLTGAHFPVALFLFLMVAVFEETLFRGIVFRMSEEGLGSIIALVFSSLLFGLVHIGNDNSSLVAAIAIAIEAGLLLSAVYMLTRSLWMAIGVHWSWNFFEGPVFGTPVSGNRFLLLIKAKLVGPEWITGGPFGPEAGIVALVIATAAGVVVLRMAIRKGRIVPPAWSKKAGTKPTSV